MGNPATLAQLSHVTARDITIQYVHHDAAAVWQEIRLVGALPPTAAGYQHRPTVLTPAEAIETSHPKAGQFVVSGLGGVGKTQLAAAFARNLVTHDLVDLVVWVPASTRSAIVSSYAAAAAAVEVGIDDPEQGCARFMGWLATTSRRWVVVLDDVPEPAVMRGLWPPDNQRGTTVVTTRRRDASLIAGRVLVEVSAFTADEARAFLSERLPPHLADDIDGLAQDLGRLPLALSHAAAHIVDLELPCSAYRRQFASRNRRLETLFPPDTSLFDDRDARTIATTWSMSIDQADRLHPHGLARPLLVLASLLDPNGIPTAVFETSATRRYVGSTPDRDLEGVDVRAGLANLRRFSMISVTESTVRVHALVQRFARESMPSDRIGDAVQAAADSLLEVWHHGERNFGTQLRANTAALQNGPETDHLWTSEGVHPVLDRMITSLGETGLIHAAVDAADRLRAANHDRLGAAHADTFTARSQWARWRGACGDVAGSLLAYKELLADQRLILGDDDLTTLTTRRHVAWWQGEEGNAAAAAEASVELLRDVRRVLGPDHPETLTVRFLVAYWQGEAGCSARAIAGLEELLADRLRVLGPDHPDTFATRGTLAYWRGESGDPAGAVAETQQLLDDRIRVLGPEHSRTLATRYNLAMWRSEAGDPVSVDTFVRLLHDDLRILGPDHPDTLTTRGMVAICLGEAGDVGGAATATVQLLDDIVRVLGPEHPDTLATRLCLAVWTGEAGDPTAAAMALDALLADYERILGADHPDTVAAYEMNRYWSRRADGDPTIVSSGHPLASEGRAPNVPSGARPGLSHWRQRTSR